MSVWLVVPGVPGCAPVPTAPGLVAERVRIGVPQLCVVAVAKQAGPGGDVGGDARGDGPAAVDLPGLRRRVAQAHGPGGADTAGLHDGVLAVDGVDVLGVVAAGHAAYDRDSRWPMSSWLAPAPSTRMRIFLRNQAGTCRIAAASTSLWSVNVLSGSRSALLLASDTVRAAFRAHGSSKP